MHKIQVGKCKIIVSSTVLVFTGSVFRNCKIVKHNRPITWSTLWRAVRGSYKFARTNVGGSCVNVDDPDFTRCFDLTNKNILWVKL